ncbi:MAG: hypothetical protein JMDDDDMK_01366 [Acidobacteria bacterium]|nr:hypothetical protein [Acidobacteriota bacterium]
MFARRGFAQARLAFDAAEAQAIKAQRDAGRGQPVIEQDAAFDQPRGRRRFDGRRNEVNHRQRPGVADDFGRLRRLARFIQNGDAQIDVARARQRIVSNGVKTFAVGDVLAQSNRAAPVRRGVEVKRANRRPGERLAVAARDAPAHRARRFDPRRWLRIECAQLFQDFIERVRC